MCVAICLILIGGIAIVCSIATTLESIVFSSAALLLLILGIIMAMPDES